MIKILYIVSTLKRSGPTTILLNIINNLDRKEVHPVVLTLSSETKDSSLEFARKNQIEICSLNLSRTVSILNGRKLLREFLVSMNPNIIHTQGFRADLLISKLALTQYWVSTIHCYPIEDYSHRYRRPLGYFLARIHLKALKRCHHLVTCSKSNRYKLQNHNIVSKVIYNGIEFKPISNYNISTKIPKPIFICIGHISKLKNVGFLVETFNEYLKINKGSLLILGNGNQLKRLQRIAKHENIIFTGRVHDVYQYISIADYYISASKTECLPTAAIECFSFGLPAILSDIEPHVEISLIISNSCFIYNLKAGSVELSKNLENITFIRNKLDKDRIISMCKVNFSALRMSNEYQSLYKVLNSNQENKDYT